MTGEQKQLVEDFQNTFATPHGKRVYNAIMAWSNYKDRILPTGHPGMVEFELGKREIFLYIMDKVECDLNVVAQQEADARHGQNREGHQQTEAIQDAAD